MIFAGDIAAPSQELARNLEDILRRYSIIFGGKRLICNFEGLISENDGGIGTKPVLFNHPSVPVLLNRGIDPVLCMANNHTLDIPDRFDSTIDTLKRANALYCGVGRSSDEAETHISFFENSKQIALINACWDFLLYNQLNPSAGVFVAEINEFKLLDDVIKIKSAKAETIVIIFLHWGLDLEILPFPMYRMLSHALIDVGADIVIGSHSHCVQGGEKYKDKYIIYGLGNFFIPNNIFANGKIRYPDFARTELVFEWVPESNNAFCHWFEYQDNGENHVLLHKGSEKFEDSVLLKKYSPFQDMQNHEYYGFFKLNRRKHFLIPIYRNHNHKMRNRLFTQFLKNRARIANLLARLGIIKWQN